MAKAGLALLLIGIGVLILYWAYFVLLAIFSENDVPLVLKLAVPVTIIGMILLLVSVIRDRLRERKEEKFKEVEF